MIKRRIANKVMFIILLATSLFACTTQNPVKEVVEPVPSYSWGNVENRTINIWGDAVEVKRPYLVRVFSRYEELTGNKIVVTPLVKDDIDQKLPKVFNDPDAVRPDILINYGGTNLTSMNPDENFYDFSDAIWVNDLTDTSINQTIYNGKVVGLPFGEASVSGTLYNKSIFSKFGISVPTTQAEFMDACQKILDFGKIPLYLPYDGNGSMLLYQFPFDAILKDTKVLEGLNDGTIKYFDLPELRKVLEWYKEMADRGFFGTDFKDNTWDGMSDALKTEKYAMLLCWDTWLYTDFKGDASKFGLMPAFMGYPDQGTYEGANVLLMVTNKHSEQLDATLDFITFLADPYNYNDAFAGIYTAPMFNHQTGNITTSQYVENERQIEKLFHDSTAWQRIEGYSQIDAVFIQYYIQGEMSIDECLKAMDNARIKRKTEKNKE